MQVTAAHEFFHAVQFAYDFYDDSWFMEGTAAWVEDEVYDDVNDNYQYLVNSPATQPHKAIDFNNQGGSFLNKYGSWYFFRYLSERFSATDQSDPSIVRAMWERADAAGSGPDDYSMQAIESVVNSNGSTMRQTYSDFAATAFVPETFFEEGVAYLTSLRTPPHDGPTADGRPPLELKQKINSSTPSAAGLGRARPSVERLLQVHSGRHDPRHVHIEAQGERTEKGARRRGIGDRHELERNGRRHHDVSRL